jgi:hypothetical protein
MVKALNEVTVYFWVSRSFRAHEDLSTAVGDDEV